MACHCELKIWCASAGATELLQLAVAEVARIETKYSRYRADSVVSQINRHAGGTPFQVDDETASLLDFAAQCQAMSAGRFDITSGVLRRAWDFKAQRPPEQATIAKLLPLVGWQYVHWDRPWFSLTKLGMEIDFGGFGKEYAADRAASVLGAAGAEHALVNLGGDVRLTGPQANGAHGHGSPWRIGIQHPRSAHQLIASIEIKEGALATSGDYERFLIYEGKRYSHLLDPHTGWPVQCAQSVSVKAPLCVFAGAMASCALLLGDAGLEFLRAQNVEFLWVDQQGNRYSAYV